MEAPPKKWLVLEVLQLQPEASTTRYERSGGVRYAADITRLQTGLSELFQFDFNQRPSVSHGTGWCMYWNGFRWKFIKLFATHALKSGLDAVPNCIAVVFGCRTKPDIPMGMIL